MMMTFDEYIDWRIKALEKDMRSDSLLPDSDSLKMLDRFNKGKDKDNHKVRKLLMDECIDDFTRMLSKEKVRISHAQWSDRWINDNFDKLDLTRR